MKHQNQYVDILRDTPVLWDYRVLKAETNGSICYLEGIVHGNCHHLEPLQAMAEDALEPRLWKQQTWWLTGQIDLFGRRVHSLFKLAITQYDLLMSPESDGLNFILLLREVRTTVSFQIWWKWKPWHCDLGLKSVMILNL